MRYVSGTLPAYIHVGIVVAVAVDRCIVCMRPCAVYTRWRSSLNFNISRVLVIGIPLTQRGVAMRQGIDLRRLHSRGMGGQEVRVDRILYDYDLLQRAGYDMDYFHLTFFCSFCPLFFRMLPIISFFFIPFCITHHVSPTSHMLTRLIISIRHSLLYLLDIKHVQIHIKMLVRHDFD